MVKTKFIAIAASAALVAMLGLSACGGQAASSSASTASSSAEASSSAASSAASSSAASSAASSSAASAEDLIVSWQGALVDGTLVDYISSDDGANGGLVLEKQGTEPKRWLGAMTTTNDGKVTITDDTSKEAISFTLSDITEDGAVLIEVEGYGKGAIVPMTAADWARVAEAEEIAKSLETEINWVGILDSGSLFVYMDNDDSTVASLAIAPLKDAGNVVKTWSGNVTKADDGKVTITDEDTKEAISFTTAKTDEDGSLNVEIDGYGKGVAVKMTYGDYLALSELL
ncbi:MAG: hypothetical protein IJ111_11810 [Eggerthellaceae bacterium]|nr:hypothetical protein [Eggerthellaceae bacterium]